jgi:hypothetical protein
LASVLKNIFTPLVITRDKTDLGGSYESRQVWVVITRVKSGLGGNLILESSQVWVVITRDKSGLGVITRFKSVLCANYEIKVRCGCCEIRVSYFRKRSS